MSLKIFQRTKFRAYACLGAYQKSKRKYRRCKGRHNKTRQKRKGRPPRVQIGYKRKVETRGFIEGKKPKIIKNLNDLRAIEKNQIALIGKIGDKNKLEIAREADKLKIKIFNLNIRKFLRKMERKMKDRKKVSEKTEKRELKNEKSQ